MAFRIAPAGSTVVSTGTNLVGKSMWDEALSGGRFTRLRQAMDARFNSARLKTARIPLGGTPHIPMRMLPKNCAARR